MLLLQKCLLFGFIISIELIMELKSKVQRCLDLSKTSSAWRQTKYPFLCSFSLSPKNHILETSYSRGELLNLIVETIQPTFTRTFTWSISIFQALGGIFRKKQFGIGPFQGQSHSKLLHIQYVVYTFFSGKQHQTVEREGLS